MTPDFDVIIVGSGPAGVSAAFPLVEAGLSVLMVDGGRKPGIAPPEADFLLARANEVAQWKWMVGDDFHALKMRDAVSPKLRAPPHAYAFEGFEVSNKIVGKDFITIGSLATGGLSNAWGCGVAHFSTSELTTFPFPAAELELSYSKVSRRMGISGRAEDDLSEYFGLDDYAQPPIAMDALHTSIFQSYDRQKNKLHAQGFRLGRSRVAALSQDMAGRQACNLSGNCLWGCQRRSLYSAVDDLPALRQHPNFRELSGFVVEGLTRRDDVWFVDGSSTTGHRQPSITASRVILAAGTLATTRIVLKTLNHWCPVPLLSCPTAAFLSWLPRQLGAPRMPGFGLGQLSFTMALDNGITAFGSTFSTTGIPISEFVRHVPFTRRYGIDLLRGLLSSCVVGNIFLPGHLSATQASLSEDGSLSVTGNYNNSVKSIMAEANLKLRKAYWSLGAMLLPGSFTVGRPGGDIHYAGTLPMKRSPTVGETSAVGEVLGLNGVYVVDGACLPVLPEKSHTLTIMANSDRIGRSIVESLRTI
jgi:choline dehydrogenase-like flavoprotein